MLQKISNINFPEFSGIRCLMMPYIQGDHESLPSGYENYAGIVSTTFIKKGEVGYLTIDESVAIKGQPHRGARAKTNRALHTEAGIKPSKVCVWGGNPGWGRGHNVTLDRDVEVLLANNLDDSCALWDTTHQNTTLDGDIGHLSDRYPYANSVKMKSGEVYKIGIFTPHESLPVNQDTKRQFLRIVSSGVHGRENYFTKNPKLELV